MADPLNRIGGEDGFDLHSRLKRTRRLYARAERAIRRAERMTLNLATAPVNQLRYAGFHILQALECAAAGDSPGAEENLTKADRHCKRSWLDAFECAVLYLLKSVVAFYADAARSVFFIERHPEVLAFQDEVKRIEDLFYSTALNQPMSLRERLRIIHETRRLGLIKRRVLCLLANDSKALPDGNDARSRAAKVARVIQDRQFLVSFAATTCGTILGTICFAMALYESSKCCDCRGWIVAGGIVFALVLMAVTYGIARRFLIPKTTAN